MAGTPLAPTFREIDKDDVPHVLARHISDAAGRALTRVPQAERMGLANKLVAALSVEGDEVASLEQLVSLVAPGHDALPHPQTPLSEVALLTNADGEPALASEISGELASADGVDLLCAFVRFAGIRVLDKGLRARRERGVPLRVITTTYVGATERRALDVLVREYGAQVKVRYEEARTRLHAKAWMFRRDSGFDTGYVGSSNLSRSAMLDGLEWNVRISGVG
ncbi:MAG: phospholipase D-like domain-containing protein, partial [Tomitella sp.]|nr:phospholipase D-like domain-containing protein [Tomitella sp.]